MFVPLSVDSVLFVPLLIEPAAVQNPTAIHSARDDFLKVCLLTKSHRSRVVEKFVQPDHVCLQVYWRHAAGDLDHYVVLISYNHSVLHNKTISAGHNDCVFSSLTPGRLYTVTVETWSGDYVSSVSTDGRTCESRCMEDQVETCRVS